MSNQGAILILAAGISKRFGSDKRAHLLSKSPMIQQTLDIYSKTSTNVYIVHRPNDGLREFVTSSCIWVEAPLAHLGMSQSIKAGIIALKKEPWVIIALADMPYVSTKTAKKLTEKLNQGALIIRPSYRGKPGNPVGFSRLYYEKLTMLKGQEGAKDLLAREQNKIEVFEVDDEGVLLDIDRESDIKDT